MMFVGQHVVKVKSNHLISNLRNLLSLHSFKCVQHRLLTADNAKQKKNYYQLLNVSPDAKPENIKDAYISLTKVHHPDRQSTTEANTQEFLQIKEAYDVLKSPVSRAEYDLTQFSRSSSINRFASGEYKPYKDHVNTATHQHSSTSASGRPTTTSGQSNSKSANESSEESTNLFSVSPRVRRLLGYLYTAIITTGLLMYWLNKRQHDAADPNVERSK